MRKTKQNSCININLPAKAGIVCTAVGVLSRAISFLFTPVFTRLLTAKAYSVYPLFLSYGAIFSTVTQVPLQQGRLYGMLSEGKEGSVISTLAFMQLLLTPASLFVYIIFRKILVAILPIDTLLITLVIIQTFLSSSESIYRLGLRYRYKYRSIAIRTLTEAIIIPLLSILIIRFFAPTGYARIIASLTVSAFITLPPLIKNVKIKYFSKEIMWDTLKYAVAVIPTSIFSAVCTQGEKLMILSRLGEDRLSVYSVAGAFGLATATLSTGVCTAILPWMIRKLKNNNEEKVFMVTKHAVRIVGLASLMFLSLSPELFSFIARGDYYSGLSSVFPIATGSVISLVASLCTSTLLLRKNRFAVFLSSFLSALVLLTFSHFLIGRLGIFGASVSHLIGITVGMTVALVCGGREVLGSKGIKQLYLFFAIILALAFLIYLLKHSLLARVLILFALLLVSLDSIINCLPLIKE